MWSGADRPTSIHSLTLGEKGSYLVFFWPVFSPNEGRYWLEKLQIRTVFTYVSEWVLVVRSSPDQACKTAAFSITNDETQN